MSKAWELYLPEVLIDVPDCPDILAVNAIRNAAIEFCEKSFVWNYDFQTDTALVAATASYTLTPPPGSAVATVTYLGFMATGATKSTPVTGPMSLGDLDFERPSWREETCDGSVNSVDAFTLNANTIRVVPIPVVNQADALVVSVALKPTRDSADGPDELYNDWLEAVAHGAKWKLMAQPKRAWSNPELASYHRTEFRRGVNKALIKTQKGGGNISMTARPRSFTSR